MFKRFISILATTSLFGCAVAQAQQPVQWNYDFQSGIATATYPGNVDINGDVEIDGNLTVNGQIVPVPANCDPTGVADATTCIQTFLNGFGTGGGIAKLKGKYLVGSNLTVPVGVSLQGECEMPGSPGTNASAPYGNYTCGVIMLSSAATITLSSGSNISHALVYRSGMTFPAPDASAFAGTAFTAAGDDVSLYAVQILGFDKAFYSDGYQRPRIEYLYADNQNGIEITNALDIPYISHSHFWPFATIASGGSYTNHIRTGEAIYLHDTVDWAHISDTFSWGYFRGIRLQNVNSTSLIGNGADNPYTVGPDYANTIGLSIEGNSADTRVYGFQAAAQATTGIYINATGATSITDPVFWGGSTHGILVDGGDTVIKGGLFGTNNGISNGLTVNSTTARVSIANARFGTITGNPISVPAANSTTYIGANDYGTFTGAVAGANLTTATVASANPLIVPNTGNVFNVSGTTNFSSLGRGWAGRCVTLIFQGVLTVTSGTGTATSIHLNAGANLTTAANDTLTACHNGVQWYETGRSH